MESHEAVMTAVAIKALSSDIPKIHDVQRIIEDSFGDRISVDEVKKFDLSDKTTITASYIAWKHNKNCGYCREKNNIPSSKTIKNLVEKAKIIVNELSA